MASSAIVKRRICRKDDSIFLNDLNGMTVLFFQQYGDTLPVRGSGGGPYDIAGFVHRIVHIAVVGTHASGLHDPVRDGRDTEISYDSDEHEYDIDRSRTVGMEDGERIQYVGDILLDDQSLNFRQHCSEQVGHWQPQIDADIAREPLYQRVVKPVENADGKGQRAQYRKYDQKECA